MHYLLFTSEESMSIQLPKKWKECQPWCQESWCHPLAVQPYANDITSFNLKNVDNPTEEAL